MMLPPEWRNLASRLAAQPCWSLHALEWVATTGSTNDDLKAGWAQAPAPHRLRVAGHQTAGRGQRGRIWTTTPGTGLLFSFSWRWEIPDSVWEIPLRAGLAMHAACIPFICDPARLWLKWPNDLCLGDGKLGGILVESTLRESGFDLVVGVGINLRRPDAVIDTNEGPALPPAAIADEATPTAEAQPWAVLEQFALQWNVWADVKIPPERLMTAYERAAAPFLGRRIRILAGDGTSLSGRVTGFAGNGDLLLADENGGQRRVGDARRVFLADAVTGPSPES